MAGVPIADSMKVTVLLLQNVTGESMQFGFHTGKREDEDSLHDIHNAAVDFANGLSGDGIICGMSIVGTSEAYWLTGGGFTGWHQIHHEDENIALSTAAQLPPQCALVASYRNTSEVTVPRGRKRNRMYLGLLRADLLENDGTIIAGDATAVRVRDERTQHRARGHHRRRPHLRAAGTSHRQSHSGRVLRGQRGRMR